MKKNSKVFELIKSLSMSEKRHFKIFAEKHVIGEKNNYIVLFNVLDKESNDLDDKIIKKLEKKKYPIKYLSADKNYLYQLILKSLMSYHASRNSRIQIKELLIQVDILHQKGLFQQAVKIVEKAKKLALETDNYSAVLECNVWYRRVAGPVYGPDKVYDSIEDSKGILSNIHSNLDYLGAYYEMFIVRSQKSRARKEETFNQIEQLVKSNLLQDENQCKDLFDKIKFHQVWAQYYFMSTNHEKEFEHVSKLVDLIEENGTYIKDFPFDYLVHKSRQLSISKFLNNNSFHIFLKNLKSLKNNKDVISKERFNFLVFYYCSMSELAYHIYQKSYVEASERIDFIKEEIEEFSKFLSPSSMMTYYYMFAYIYLAIGEPKNALKEVNLILNDYSEKDRLDLYHFTRLLNLIIHFELENVSLIPYLHKSTESYFKKNGSLFPLENKLMSFFKNVTEDKDHKKLEADLIQLDKDVKDLNIKESDATASLYFDLGSWLKSRISKISMKDL